MAGNLPWPASGDAGTGWCAALSMNAQSHGTDCGDAIRAHPPATTALGIEREWKGVASYRGASAFRLAMEATWEIAMLRGALLGAVAGAVGNLTLEVVTYGDMLLRGRTASGVPAKMAGILADGLGIEALSSETTGERATAAAAPPVPCSATH